MRLDVPAAEVTVTSDDVRRMTLRAQGFLGATPWRGTRAGVAAMLRRVGAVQLDTISVLARSHELVAYARLGPVPREQIERAYWHPAKPAAFEYWAHAACVLPLDQWPYFAFRRHAFRTRGVRWHQSHAETCDKVLARLRAEGPLTATQLGGAKGGGPWWDWSDVKIAVEWLLDMGDVICVRRSGWRRLYDLPERVLPAELLDVEPSDLECLTYLAGVAARALGVVTHADLVDYHRLNILTNEKGQHTRMVAEAALAAGLTPVAIVGSRAGMGRAGGLARTGGAGGLAGTGGAGGLAGPGRAGASAADLRGWADPAALAEAWSRGRNRVTLLSPFDSLVWDRKRTLRMFGFQHSLEAYVPKHKRVHGYFTMPLLAGGRLVGRVDPAREGTTLVARRVSLEAPAAAEPMAQALREAAGWVGCDDVRIDHIEPAEQAPRLVAALQAN
ncbi:MAG TPA: crosslink repair DNA glycosylase YcaQ family protein [Streptosporangiaceae bacterium]